MRAYALVLLGIALAIAGMALPWFAGGAFRPQGYGGSSFSTALDSPVGRALFGAASLGWVAVLAAHFAPSGWRRGFAWAGTLTLFGLAALLLFSSITCPLDAGCTQFGAWLAVLGFVLSGLGGRTIARSLRTANAPS